MIDYLPTICIIGFVSMILTDDLLSTVPTNDIYLPTVHVHTTNWNNQHFAQDHDNR